MHNLINTVLHFIQDHQLVKAGDTIIIGLSGGPDSVFLLHVLHEYRKKMPLKLIAAHLDHQWRTESGNDVLFCKKLCESLEIPFVHSSADQLPAALQKKGSKEEIGRRMRRYFLQMIKQDYNAHSIALGHHLNDQEETFFIRLIRGSTLAGLTCMKPRENAYIRPLLALTKKDILEYLHANTISYLTDPSNESESFLRNRIRLNVIPAIKECDARFDTNFVRTLSALQETEQYLQTLTAATFQTLAEFQDSSWHLSLEQFKALDPFMQKRVLLYWLIKEQVPFTPTASFLDEILRFLYTKQGGSHTLAPTWALEKKQGKILIIKI
ncbi:MAG: tRNA lysidine(34) synthetase TilS [Candidatus Babeliales bacterium]